MAPNPNKNSSLKESLLAEQEYTMYDVEKGSNDLRDNEPWRVIDVPTKTAYSRLEDDDSDSDDSTAGLSPFAKIRSKWTTMHTMVALNMMAMIGLGTFNTVARKIALVPLNEYPYFLTQLSSVASTVMYGTGVAIKYRNGTVTKEMLSIGKLIFVGIGFFDALGDLLGNVGVKQLPGTMVPLLAKTNIPLTMFFSMWLLKTSYHWGQFVGAVVVIGGFLAAFLPTNMIQGGNLVAVLVYLVSIVPTVVGMVCRELVFRREQKKGNNLDVFVVGFFINFSQLIWTFLLIPIAAVPGLGKVPLADLPSYFANGFVCFSGSNPTAADDCTGSPYAPLIYLAINLMYNLAIIFLLKFGGATLMFVTNTITFPMSTMMFSFSWPLLSAVPFTIWTVIGLLIESLGVVIYRVSGMLNKKKQ
eukprot:GFYU01000722.1.p1 GENE.GFYU01000722.1~~GFYU01000722.1.p1  ORF type:complete len:415 (+),score=129.18 GFYU01000722.1:153-1397(+)